MGDAGHGLEFTNCRLMVFPVCVGQVVICSLLCLLATMMLPGVVTMIPIFIIFKEIGWVGTFFPLWVPSWFGIAFYIFLMRQYMMTLPIELDEAAKIDGASNFRILWRVIAPLCGPAIATVTIFAFLQHYNAFMEPLIYISEERNVYLALGAALV